MDDLAWLQEFETRIWPQEGQSGGLFWDVPTITADELIRICEIIRRAELVVVLWTYGPLGGIGMSLYAHEAFPGTGPEEVFRIKDKHIPQPSRTWHERLLDAPAVEVEKRSAGCIRQDVWELFSRYSHTERNREWLKRYGLKMRFERTYYDY